LTWSHARSRSGEQMRKISKDKYIIATFLTLGIFFLGLLLGFVIEAKRVSYIRMLSQEQELDFTSLQLQYQYIDQLNQEDDCDAVLKTSDNYIESLESARLKLESYNEVQKISKQDFEILKREYILSQLNYWLFSTKTKELCDADAVILLYFFSTDEKCPRCEQQAFILTYLKKKLDDKILTFALDSEYIEEPMITLLKERYDVTEFPTLVIEDAKYVGLTSKEAILKEICPHYKAEVKECVEIE